jgi:hypothetical protein
MEESLRGRAGDEVNRIKAHCMHVWKSHNEALISCNKDTSLHHAFILICECQDVTHPPPKPAPCSLCQPMATLSPGEEA